MNGYIQANSSTYPAKVSEADKLKVFLSYVGYVYGMKHDYERRRSELANRINKLGIKRAYIPTSQPERRIAQVEPTKSVNVMIWILAFCILNFIGLILVAIYQFLIKKKIAESNCRKLQEQYDQQYANAMREWERQEQVRRENFSRGDDTRVDKEKVVREQLLREYNVIQDALKDIDRYLHDAYELRIVHPDYMGELPVKVMLHYLDAGMADTLKEALKEYTEYIRHEEIKFRLDVTINNQAKMMRMMQTTINLVKDNKRYLRQISECEIESLQYQKEQLSETKKMRKTTEDINKTTKEMAFYTEVSAFCDAYSLYKSRNR